VTQTYENAASIRFSVPWPGHSPTRVADPRFPLRRVPLMIAFAGLLAAALLVYLVYALVKPEQF
jgi:K+-transporting ATPase KdpF subunit